jgi:hypothetical protein
MAPLGLPKVGIRYTILGLVLGNQRFQRVHLHAVGIDRAR